MIYVLETWITMIKWIIFKLKNSYCDVHEMSRNTDRCRIYDTTTITVIATISVIFFYVPTQFGLHALPSRIMLHLDCPLNLPSDFYHRMFKQVLPSCFW